MALTLRIPWILGKVKVQSSEVKFGLKSSSVFFQTRRMILTPPNIGEPTKTNRVKIISLSLSLSLALSLSLSLSISLTFSLSLHFSYFLSVSLFLSLSLPLFIYLSFPLSFSQCLSLSQRSNSDLRLLWSFSRRDK